MNQNNGPFHLIVSGFFAGISWISLHDLQPIATLLATLVSICSGILAARYYYKKAKSIK